MSLGHCPRACRDGRTTRPILHRFYTRLVKVKTFFIPLLIIALAHSHDHKVPSRFHSHFLSFFFFFFWVLFSRLLQPNVTRADIVFIQQSNSLLQHSFFLIINISTIANVRFWETPCHCGLLLLFFFHSAILYSPRGTALWISHDVF